MEPIQNSKITIAKKDTLEDLKIEIVTLNQVEAPVEKDKKVGYVKIKLGNTAIRNLDLFVEEGVGRKEYPDYLREILRNCLS